MAKLYYGNGNCSIEGSDIKGVQITYSGAVEIDDKTSDSFALAVGATTIVIFPLKAGGTLNDLFDYRGELKILTVITADSDANKITPTINRVMDYAELLSTNAEDMTTLSEDLKATHTYRKVRDKTSMLKKIIPHLHTSGGELYLKDGTEYRGDYHIHIIGSAAMTGKNHDDNSQDLFYKKMKDGKVEDELIPTRVSKADIEKLKKPRNL